MMTLWRSGSDGAHQSVTRQITRKKTSKKDNSLKLAIMTFCNSSQ